MTTNVYKSVNSTSGGGGGDATPFTQAFDATTSWGSPSSGEYSITVQQATHQKGTDPLVQVYETVAGVDYLVDVNSLEVNAAGDVTVKVTQNLDTRFAGKLVIL